MEWRNRLIRKVESRFQDRQKDRQFRADVISAETHPLAQRSASANSATNR
jgi:hypothetical protein